MRNKVVKIVILVAILILGSIIIYNIFGPSKDKTPKIVEVNKITYAGYEIPIGKSVTYKVGNDNLLLKTGLYSLTLGIDYSNKIDDYKNNGYEEIKVKDKTYYVLSEEKDGKYAKHFVTKLDKKVLIVGMLVMKNFKEVKTSDFELVNSIILKPKKLYEVEKNNAIENAGIYGVRKYTFNPEEIKFN